MYLLLAAVFSSMQCAHTYNNKERKRWPPKGEFFQIRSPYRIILSPSKQHVFLLLLYHDSTQKHFPQQQ